MILGIGSWLEIMIAIVFYMVAYSVTTELFKPLLRIDGGKALLLSWVIGLIFLTIIGLTKLLIIRAETVILFVFITGITNGVYARWEALRNFLKKLFGKDV